MPYFVPHQIDRTKCNSSHQFKMNFVYFVAKGQRHNRARNSFFATLLFYTPHDGEPLGAYGCGPALAEYPICKQKSSPQLKKSQSRRPTRAKKFVWQSSKLAPFVKKLAPVMLSSCPDSWHENRLHTTLRGYSEPNFPGLGLRSWRSKKQQAQVEFASHWPIRRSRDP